MITIYGSPRSSAGRCFWCLEEVGAEYESKSIDFKKDEHKSEEFMKINPNGKIPVLTDGDFTIWESMGINFYLADAYRPELLGGDVKERGLVHQWSLWSIAELQPPLIEVFIQLVFIPEERRSSEVIKKAQGKLPALLRTLDNELERKKYLAGDHFSLADLNTASVVSICESIEYDFSKYNNVKNWLDAISDRPGFQRFKELCK